MIVTVLPGAVGERLSNTGTVTSESLTITMFGANPVIGLSAPATNWKGEASGGYAGVTVTVSPPLFVAWVRQFTASSVSGLPPGTKVFTVLLHEIGVRTHPAMASRYATVHVAAQAGTVVGAGNDDGSPG
jgi:hypothetical protein